MSEKLREIDTSAIEKLIKIKKDQDRLAELRRKADKIKDTVDETIYRKVRADYASRESALDEEATPLKAEARGEYEKLCVIHDQLKQSLEQALGVKQELEFRHAVQEFDKAELAEKLNEPERAIEQYQAQLGDADRLKAQFLSAFRSEEELKINSEEQPEVNSALQPELYAEIQPEFDSEIQPEFDSMRPSEEESEEQPEDASSPQFEAIEIGDEQPAAAPANDKTSARPPSEVPAGTSVEPKAKLVKIEEGQPTDEYPLGASNTIGRAEDNDIRIPSQTVSRKHAVVTASAASFTVKDLNSRSGTFVNEEKISECALTDGDRVKIGDVELIFRLL